MRYALLFLVLAAQPLAAQSQPLAPEDSALVERLLDVSGTTQSAEAMEQQFADMPMMGAFTDSLMAGFSPQMFVDSVRAAFTRDFDREAISAAINALSDPSIRPVLDFQQSMGSGNNTELTAEIMAVILNPDKYALADSVTVQRLVTASGMVDQFREVMQSMMEIVVSAMPAALLEAESPGVDAEKVTNDLMEEQVKELARTIVLGSRYVYRDVPPEALERLTDFYLSPAGRYYLSTSYAGTNAATELINARLGDFFASMFSDLDVSGDAPAEQDD